MATTAGLVVCWTVGMAVARHDFALPVAVAATAVFLLVFFRKSSLLWFGPLAMCIPNMGLDIPGPWAISIEDAFVILALAALAFRSIVLRRSFIPRDIPFFRPLALFWGVACLSILKTALLSRHSLMFIVKDLMRLTLLLVFFIAMTDVIRTKRDVMNVVKALLILSIPMAMVSWYIYLTQSPFFYKILTMKPAYIYYRYNVLRMISIAGSTSFTGLYYATMLALAVHFAPLQGSTVRNALRWSLVALLVSCLALTFNRGTWVGVMFGYLVLTLVGQLNWRRLSTAAMLLGGLVLIASLHFFSQLDVENKLGILVEVSRSSGTARLIRWLSSINVMIEQPLLGVGYNNYAYVYGLYSIQEGLTRLYGSPHNMYVDILTGTGMIGFVVFSVFLLRLWRAHRRNVDQCRDPELRTLSLGLLLAYGIFLGASAFDSFLFKPHHTSFILMILWAITAAIGRIDREGTHGEPGPVREAES